MEEEIVKPTNIMVGEDGYYVCPECDGVNYLDSFEFQELTLLKTKKCNCPMCKNPLTLLAYGIHSNPEL